jgi:hypothetical protein
LDATVIFGVLVAPHGPYALLIVAIELLLDYLPDFLYICFLARRWIFSAEF